MVLGLTYVDVAIIAILALYLLVGFLGRAPRKLFGCFFVIVAAVASYFLTDIAFNYVLQIKISGKEILVFVQDFITQTLGENASMLPANLVNGLVAGLLKVFTFFAVGIVMLILIPAIGNGIVKACTKDSPKGTAWYTFGIPNVIKGAVVWFMLLFPLFSLTPLIKAAPDVLELMNSMNESSETTNTTESTEPQAESEEGEDDAITKILNQVNEQIEKSYVCKYVDKFFAFFEKKAGTFKVYEVTIKDADTNEDKKCNLMKTFNDLAALPGQLQPMLKLMNGGDELDMSSINSDDIRALLENEVGQEMIKAVVGPMLEESVPGLDLSNIDFGQEADTICAVIDLASRDMEAEPMTAEEITDLVDDLADSELILAVASSAEGAMVGMLDDSQVADLETQLQAKVNAEGSTFSQEDMDTILALFKEVPTTPPEE